MGEKNITTQVKIDGEIVPDFSFDWAVEFQGEKYIMPLRIPQGAKDNTSLKSTIDLTFQHWAIYQLKRWPFVTIQQIAAGTYLPDEEVAPVQLNLKDFCILCGQVLEYYYGGAITMDFNDDPVTGWQYKQEATRIEISHTKIWNVLIDAFHDKYGVRWEIKAASDNSNTIKGGERYVIRVGYPTTEVDHIFEYGFEGGLLKVERQVQSEEIRNMLKGRGGEKNIPFRYFKNTDPNNKDFRPDPDWVEELANIPFTNLMPATFRSYIQGWKAAHISKYPGYTAVGENNAYAPWAYRKGYTDTKFHPVEFVADEITINPGTGDKQVEILPGYSPYVKKGSSLDKYGPLPDTLDNNDDIYPTLQGTGLDIAVDVEQIESDDVAESTENDAQIEDKTYPDIVKRSVPQGHATAADASKRTYFTVPTGKKANIEGYAGAKAYNPQNNEDKSALIAELDYTIKVFNATTGEQHSASGIPAGNWYFTVEYSFNNTSSDALNVTLSFNSVKITSATPDDKWRNTFDIWVKNIWDSTRLTGETDSQYSERVWKPVLGDREGNAAKVVFTSGALVHEDYEFTIVDFPVPDTSKTYEGEQSHWRITLAKSEAELEATGLYVPSTKKQGKAGDTFVFIGTEMTHVPYVVDAEVRQADWLKDQLGEVKEIKPTAVVTTDRVRLNNEGKPNALINQLRVGNSLRLFDKRFFNEDGKAYETLYLQSITYTYREPTSDDAALNPDVEIVLGNEYTASANPVSMMQGEISALQRQVGSISNVEQIVRAVGDRLYLRKDGISDRSLSPTQFLSLLTSGDFRAGMIGGAGWGFYKDENGNWVLEADRVNVRQEMQVNTLVINQAKGRGGMEIDTAAYIDGVTRIVETDSGYVCYFDQKGGSVANLFHVDDVAYCNRWTPENAQLKYYKRRVVSVGTDNITLTKALSEAQRPVGWPDSGVNGTGIPAEGDNIIHFGSYTDATRQYVKVRDVVGGGYERYIEALDSVDAEGVEYYFVGKQAGESRWFVGNKDLVPYSGDGDGSYIEYINRKFNLNNVSLSINTTIGDKTLEEYIKLVSPPVEQEDIEQFVNNIVNPKLEGIQNQIDGVIESFFGFGAPTLDNYPANEWATDELRAAHERDTYTDKTEYVDDATTPTAGQSWKWQYTSPTDYGWVKIADSDAVKALLDAAKAQDTADGKRRVFTSQPAPPYDEGDLWVNATYPAGTTAETRDPSNGKYYNDILRCGSSHATGAFAIGDWGLSSNYTDDTAANKALAKIEGFDYIKNALPQDTQITGGLIMSTLISLGYKDSNNVRHTLAGMNGSWVDTLGGRTIGSWWGGPMVDLFDENDNKRNLTQGSYATSLVRMDGSAYFADGNVGFRKNGSGWLAGDNIKWDATGAITFGNGIKIDLGGGDTTTLGGLNTTLASLINVINSFSNILMPVDASGNKVSWDSPNLYAIKAVKSLYSDSWLSAYGVDDGGESGGGGIDETTLSQYLTQHGYATQAWVNGRGFLTQHQSLAHLLRIDGSNGTAAGVSALINKLGVGDAAPVDADYYVAQSAGGGTSNTTYYRRPVSALWSYIKRKADANYVTLDTAQTIEGHKIFSALNKNAYGNWVVPLTVKHEGHAAIEISCETLTHGMGTHGNGNWYWWRADGWPTNTPAANARYIMQFNGSLFDFHHQLRATKLILYGGTSSQFLKADGSTDSTAYLPLTGGLMDNGAITLGGSGWLILKHPDTTGGTAKTIYFRDHDGTPTYGFGSMVSNHVPQFGYIGWGAEPWDIATSLAVGATRLTYKGYDIIHMGNYVDKLDGRYVKKSGDTMTGALTINMPSSSALPLILNSASTSEIGLRLQMSSANKGWVGYHPTYGTNLYNYNCNKYLAINDSGVPNLSGSTIWHAGNDGAGSGLDADMLDGKHASHFVDRLSTSNGSDNLAQLKALHPALNDSVAHTVRLEHGTHSMAFGWFLAGYALDNAYGGWFISDYSTPRWIGVANGSWKSETFAFLSSNVASATKLQTARTIWGQSFNGTANVSGDLTGVGNIYFSDSARINNYSSEYYIGLIKGGTAYGFAAGKLLISDLYANISKVPANGAYIKGDIVGGSLISAPKIKIGNVTLVEKNGALWCDKPIVSESYLSGYGLDS